jgi:transposase
MNMHKNARLTPLGRERLVAMMASGQTPQAAARAAGVCPRTARKWQARYKAEGAAGLQDRSSRPKTLRKPTPAGTANRILSLRRQRWTAAHIARETGVSPSTVSRILTRAGRSRLRDIEPAEPSRRYDRKAPGEIIHLDIKKLGRFERTGHRITGDRTRQSNPRARKQGGYGWEYVHVAIDDNSRLSFSRIHPNEKTTNAVAHLKAAVA